MAATAFSAMAQPDPPSRVARLNLISGPVSFRPGSVDEWTAATLNYPMTTGDHLWTDNGAKSEFHVGSTAVRLDQGTALSVLNLTDNILQLSITEGAIDVRVRYLAENDSVEVDTPNSAVVILRPGDYRIGVRGDDMISNVTVRAGEAEVNAGGAGQAIHSGDSLRLIGQGPAQPELGPAPPPDAFDAWCQTRDRREAGMVSARYVPREMIGYEDLDEYGVWADAPGYGMVWRPRGIAVGWAPYHYGHWAWVDPWGWTWIDEAPWGFAPFHYGRWAFGGGGWFWVPGRMSVVGVAAVRPVYAPALVAFVGGGGFSLSVGIGGGGVAAWFPLGPGEVYRPAYHVSATYVQNINVVHVTNVSVINQTNITNVRYVNQSVVGAVTVVPHEAFVSARPVAQAAVVVPHEQIMRAQVVGYTASVAPVHASVVAGVAVGVHGPPARFETRQVVVRNAPPPPPVSFQAKEAALRSNGGRPLNEQQINTVRRDAPAVHPMVRQNVGSGQPGGGQPGGGQPGGGQPRGGNNQQNTSTPPRQNDRPAFTRPPANTGNPGGANPSTGNGGANSTVQPKQNQNTPQHVGTQPASTGGSPSTGGAPSGGGAGANPHPNQNHENKGENKVEKKAAPHKGDTKK